MGLLVADFYFFRPARFVRLLNLALSLVGFVPLSLLWLIALSDPGKARSPGPGEPQSPPSSQTTE